MPCRTQEDAQQDTHPGAGGRGGGRARHCVGLAEGLGGAAHRRAPSDGAEWAAAAMGASSAARPVAAVEVAAAGEW